MISPLLALRALSSILKSRSDIAGGAGWTFNGMRNVDEALGYEKELTITQYRARYERNPIAGRIIDMYPDETWAGYPEIVEDTNPETITPFEQAWIDLEARHNIWSTFNQVDILSGMGRYGGLLIGAVGKLDEELPNLNGENAVLFIKPYDEEDLKVKVLETDSASPRYGLPKTYTLRGSRLGKAGLDLEVHESRVIHIVENPLHDNVYSRPRLERVWNRLNDLDKLIGGGCESFWVRAHQGYHFDLDPEVKLDQPGEEEALTDEIDEFMHKMRRAIRTQGVKVKALGSDVADFNDNAAAVIDQIAAGCGIPQRILLGSERGELASSNDISNWMSRVHSRRSKFAGPRAIGLLVSRLIKYRGLPEPGDAYDIRWPVYEPTMMEQAELALKMADVNQKNGSVVITEDEIRDRAFQWEPLSSQGSLRRVASGSVSFAEIPRAATARKFAIVGGRQVFRPSTSRPLTVVARVARQAAPVATPPSTHITIPIIIDRGAMQVDARTTIEASQVGVQTATVEATHVDVGSATVAATQVGVQSAVVNADDVHVTRRQVVTSYERDANGKVSKIRTMCDGEETVTDVERDADGRIARLRDGEVNVG